jgi:hypothetical protein
VRDQSRQVIKIRQNNLRERLRLGKPHGLRKYLPGAENILIEFGIDPGAAALPSQNEGEVEKDERRKDRYRYNYKVQREKIGSYKSTKDNYNQREIELLKQAKSRIINFLSNFDKI